MSSIQLYASIGLTVVGLAMVSLGRSGSEGKHVAGAGFNLGSGLVLTVLGIGLATLYFLGTSLF